MKKSKLIFIVLTVFSMISVLSACNKSGDKDTASPMASVSVNSAPAVTDAPKETDAPKATDAPAPKEIKTLSLVVHASWVLPGYQAVIDLVNSKSEELGAKIELEKVAEGDTGDQVIQTKFAAQEMPDILSFYDATWVGKLGGAKNFEDVTGDWMKDYDAAALNTPKYTAEGKLVVVPFGAVGTMNLFYNKKVFTDSGVQVPNNWTEFLAVAKTLKEKGIQPIYYSGKDAWTLQIIPLVGAVRDSKEKVTDTADALSTNKTHFTDLKLFVDSIAKLKELNDKGYVNKTFLSDDYATAQQMLLDGKIGMFAMGSWVVGDLQKLDKVKLNDIGAFGIPFDEGQLMTISPPGGLFIPAGGKNIELAKKVVAFMASPEAQAAYFKAQPDIPFIKGLTVEGLFPAQLDIQKAIDEGKTFASPLDFTKYQKGPFEKYLQDVLVGSKTPEKAAAELDKDFAKAAKAKQDPNWNK